MVRLITCHILCLLLLIAPACQHRSAYRAGGDGRGYASKIDTITKIDSTETDSLNGEKKLLHQRLDAFHKKMTKKIIRLGMATVTSLGLPLLAG